MVINSVQEEGARHTTQGHTEAHRGRSEGRGSRGPVGKRLLVAPMGGNGQIEQCRLVGVNDLAGPGPQGCPEVVQAGRIDPEEKSPVRGGGWRHSSWSGGVHRGNRLMASHLPL